MTNPYQPPTEKLAPILPTGQSFFVGGFITVAFLGVFLGAIIGALLFAPNWSSPVVIWFIPALGWYSAFVALVCMIRSTRLSIGGKILVAILMPIPAYILYVPVCVAGTFFTMPFLGSKNYQPSTSAVCIASAFAFVVVLFLFAGLVRTLYRQTSSQFANDETSMERTLQTENDYT